MVMRRFTRLRVVPRKPGILADAWGLLESRSGEREDGVGTWRSRGGAWRHKGGTWRFRVSAWRPRRGTRPGGLKGLVPDGTFAATACSEGTRPQLRHDDEGIRHTKNTQTQTNVHVWTHVPVPGTHYYFTLQYILIGTSTGVGTVHSACSRCLASLVSLLRFPTLHNSQLKERGSSGSPRPARAHTAI